MHALPITKSYQAIERSEGLLTEECAPTFAAHAAPRRLPARMGSLPAQPASFQEVETTAPATKDWPVRAWWQSSWFWPWVLPTAQGSEAR